MSTTAEWLISLGLPEYERRFAENGIEFDVLQHLTDQDLKDVGVLLGHRRKMLAAIAELTDAVGSSSARAPEPQDTAERRQLSVMFCDLVGSTLLSRQLDPEDLRAIITVYHRCCTELVERNGGFVAKYMGDGILAYFGYPRASEHDAERAVRAGLAVVEAVPKLASAAGSPLQVRVGIATGLAVVGDLIGTGAALEQAVIGETPNLAARLQALAEPGAVVISASTRRLTGGLFVYLDLGAVALKGFGEEVPAWQVVGASVTQSRFEALRAATTPLVGRDEEIDLLMRQWQKAKTGEGQAVLISGEPGIGKSRIAQTIVERMSGEPHSQLRYFCSPHHQDSALYPLIVQIERMADIRREDTDDERLAKLEAAVTQGPDQLPSIVPLLADLLSIPVGDRYPPLNLTPQKRKEKTLHALLAGVERLAAKHPVLIIFEDLHWSDPTSREWLDLLIDRLPLVRVLLAVTFRPEFMPLWVARPHVTMLNLNRLPQRQRAEMIFRITNDKTLPDEIADQIIDRTDGVPLFIEELTKMVMESGILIDAGDRYTVVESVTALAIPATLQGSLLARLDRLPSTREVAQIGAALGRTFSHELISAVANLPQQQVDDALVRLERAELLFRRGSPPNAEYTFKHALVQDVAYDTLLRNRRQEIHVAIVSTLETRFGEIVATQPQLMAHHSIQGGLNEKAINYCLKAGQRATTRSAMAEAVAQLQKGLALIANLPDSRERQAHELDLQTALGPALVATRGYSAPDVGLTWARARALAEELDRSEHLVTLFYGQWAYHLVRAEHRQALELAQQLEQIGEKRNDPLALLLGHFEHGCSRLFCGDFVRARSLFEQCHGMRDPGYRAKYLAMTGDDKYLSTLVHLGMALEHLGYVDQGRRCMTEALAEARRLNHPYTLGLVSAFACWSQMSVASLHETGRLAEQTIAVSNEQGFPFWLAIGWMYQGWSLTGLQRKPESVDLLSKGLSMYRATGAVLTTPMLLLMQAEALGWAGKPKEGLICLSEADGIVETTQERYAQADMERIYGDLHTATGDERAAEAHYQRAISVAEKQCAKVLELHASTSLARLWRDQGKHTQAHDLLAPAYEWFTEGFDTPILKGAKALLDELNGTPHPVCR